MARKRRLIQAALKSCAGPSFPEVVAGTVQLPDATALDGE
ncbi:hypothetical protein SAM23877_0252 [Streptomyces ambofaciens ATCC 23877]|uniref:Uncharacterized protein n=1 Tax=Streptomyces ambofaciens (strain ATCC 23877 / 3486 / DSM 40053 / JCM 4204 / NBRC 12836 / NRRL B-2516) TaxID=278992 RepID=A0A0K2AK65_STRA7|nr:hypothetical protein SAM23877_0252 [Streptomyces ambofaciens ATCC 23877]